MYTRRRDHPSALSDQIENFSPFQSYLIRPRRAIHHSPHRSLPIRCRLHQHKATVTISLTSWLFWLGSLAPLPVRCFELNIQRFNKSIFGVPTSDLQVQTSPDLTRTPRLPGKRQLCLQRADTANRRLTHAAKMASQTSSWHGQQASLHVTIPANSSLFWQPKVPHPPPHKWITVASRPPPTPYALKPSLSCPDCSVETCPLASTPSGI